MLDIVSGVFLGVVQGLTEFIPVSSSGHLILAREWLGLAADASDLAFDAVLQLATVVAVLVYFRKEIFKLAKSFSLLIVRKETDSAERTMLAALVVGTIPAVVAGLFLESYMETAFRSGTLVAWTLLIGAGIMFAADRFAKQDKEFTWGRGLVVGLFQTLALVPGISRSGATISGGLFAGLSREAATKFSFLLSVPILLGSGLKKLFDLVLGDVLFVGSLPLAFGCITAFLSGLAAIHFLISYLRRHDLRVFIGYRVLLAAVLLWFL